VRHLGRRGEDHQDGHQEGAHRLCLCHGYYLVTVCVFVALRDC
jgi:hypothetical protein